MMTIFYRHKRFVFVLLTVVVLLSCKQAKQQDPQTKIFSDYLEEHFSLKIPVEQHYYILVPKDGCQGGIANTLTFLDADTFYTTITVITSHIQIVNQYLHHNWPVLSDEKADLDILNLPITNVSVIATKDEKITAIKSTSQCDAAPVELIKLLKKS